MSYTCEYISMSSNMFTYVCVGITYMWIYKYVHNHIHMYVFMNVCASKCYTQRHTHITHLPGGLLPAGGETFHFQIFVMLVLLIEKAPWDCYHVCKPATNQYLIGEFFWRLPLQYISWRQWEIIWLAPNLIVFFTILSIKSY